MSTNHFYHPRVVIQINAEQSVVKVDDRTYFHPSSATIDRIIHYAVSNWVSKERGELGLWYLVKRP